MQKQHLAERRVLFLCFGGDVSPAGGDGGMFRLRAGYFPAKESSQSSPGLRARTRGSHPERKPGLDLTGAGADLWLCSFPRPLPLCGGQCGLSASLV